MQRYDALDRGIDDSADARLRVRLGRIVGVIRDADEVHARIEAVHHLGQARRERHDPMWRVWQRDALPETVRDTAGRRTGGRHAQGQRRHDGGDQPDRPGHRRTPEPIATARERAAWRTNAGAKRTCDDKTLRCHTGISAIVIARASTSWRCENVRTTPPAFGGWHSWSRAISSPVAAHHMAASVTPCPTTTTD